MLKDPIKLPEPQEVDWAERLNAYYYLGRMLLAQYWWVVLLSIALGVVYQVWRTLSRDPLFASQSRMFVSGRIALPEGSAAYREELSNFFGTQIELMKSEEVRNRAREIMQARYPHLRACKVELDARQQPNASIFILQAQGTVPEYVQRYLDAIMEAYISFRRGLREQTSNTALNNITEQIYNLERDIQQQENALVDFQKENNLIFLKEQGNTAGSYLARLKNTQAEYKTQLLQLENLDLSAFATATADEDAVARSGDLLKLVDLSFAREYFAGLREWESVRTQLVDFGQYLKPAHPKMIRLAAEADRLARLVQIYREQAIARIDEQKRLLQQQIANLDKIIANWETTALENSRKNAEFERLNSRLERTRLTHQRLLDSLQSVNLNQKLEQDLVYILETAGPARPIGSTLRHNILRGALFGLVSGVGLLVLLRLIDNRIISAEDLKSRFEPAVLSVIPLEKNEHSKPLELLRPRDERTLFAEACRTLRSSLLFMNGPKGPPSCVVVTSSVPDEGKSTIAANLAVAISFTSSRTLLLDADLRRGHLHKLLGREQKPGLSEWLLGGVKLENILQPTDFPHLDFLTTGTYPERPGELFLSPRMDELLGILRQRYEFIVIDSAPVLAIDDTAGFAAKTDAVLFVVRSNYTQVRQVKVSLERLQLRGISVAGFVLNFVDVRGSDYYYYKKYKNYYSAPPLVSN